MNTETAIRPHMGPGTYDERRHIKSEKTYRRSTANFLVNKRPDNLFSIVESNPAPTDYNTSASQPDFKAKFWSSSVEAFGNTEKRFKKDSETFD